MTAPEPRKCAEPGCKREPVASADGVTLHGLCSAHEREALMAMFGPKAKKA